MSMFKELQKQNGPPGRGRTQQTNSTRATAVATQPNRGGWASRKPENPGRWTGQRQSMTTKQNSSSSRWSSNNSSTNNSRWSSTNTTRSNQNTIWGKFTIPSGTLPYAYGPSNEMINTNTGRVIRGFKIPSFWEVMKDLGWWVLEAMLAAAGHAVFQFFKDHRRFHPGPGR